MLPRRRVTILVANLIISFVICWLPFHTWHIMRLSGLELTARMACRYIRDVTFCLAYLNSDEVSNCCSLEGALWNALTSLNPLEAMNPILYSFLGYGFRNRLFNAIKRIKSIIPKRRLSARAPSNVSLGRRSQQRRRCSSIGVLDYL